MSTWRNNPAGRAGGTLASGIVRRRLDSGVMYYQKTICDALIFVHPCRRLSDEEFALEVFRRLAITKWQGYGANTSDAVAYRGDAAGIEVAIVDIQDGDGPYPFLVWLRPMVAYGETDYLVEHARNLGKYWSHSGWSCFVPRERLYEITNYVDGYLFLPASVSAA